MKHKIFNEYLEVEINSLGAELCSMKKVNEDLEYMWQGNPTYWNRQAPILFPTIGKLLDGIYTYDGKTYKMPQHGFAREYEFTVIQKNKNSIFFELTDKEETLLIYPFKFSLILGYTLIKNSLEVSYEVINKSLGEMKFSIGAHPAFNWPLGNEKKEECYFEFEDIQEMNTFSILKSGISRDKILVKSDKNKIWLTESVFKKDALIFNDLITDKITFKNTKNNRFLEMTFNKFPYIGLWSKPTGAPFICIEPWHGIADFVGHNQKFEDKDGLITLSSKKEFKSSYTIKI